MNCKPGDLAVVVGGFVTEIIGRIVTITAACGYHADHWDTDPPILLRGYRHPMSLHDSTVRPIRDPGEDAQDQTLLWLPLPSKETAT